MIKRSLRNKSERAKEIKQFAEEVRRGQRKHKTGVQEQKEQTSALGHAIKQIIYSSVSSSCQIAIQIEAKYKRVDQLFSKQLDLSANLVELDEGIIEMPMIIEDMQPLPDPKHKVENKFSFPSNTFHFEKMTESNPDEDVQHDGRSQKEIIQRLKRDFFLKLKISKDKRESKVLDVAKIEEELLKDNSLHQFRKQIPKRINLKSFKSEMNKSLTNEDCIYGYDGQPIKVKTSENNFKVQKKGKKQKISISLLSNQIKQQINREEPIEVNHERQSQHLEGAGFRSKMLQTLSFEQFMSNVLKPKKGINIEQKNEKSSRSKGMKSCVKLPSIDQRKQ